MIRPRKRKEIRINKLWQGRSAFFFVTKGALGGLKHMLSGHKGDLTDDEILETEGAIFNLEKLIENAKQRYLSIIKPRFIKRATEEHEARQKLAANSGDNKPQEDSTTTQEPSDKPQQELNQRGEGDSSGDLRESNALHKE